jgi:CRP/FNR family transcriptional regulator, cyclic AMP receptor protein
MNEMLKAIVAAHPFVKGMTAAHLDVLVDCARLEVLEPGRLLFIEGQPASEFYMLQDGKIALEVHRPNDGTVRVDVLGADDVLGWSWLFPPYAWHLRARVLEPTNAIVLNAARLLINAERDHDFGYILMKRVSHVLMERLKATQRELLTRQSEPELAV